jgi:hypothetical protein
VYESVAEASNMILASGKNIKIPLKCILLTFFPLFGGNIDVLLSF